MPPIKFQLNPPYSLGGDVVWRFSRLPTWRPSWISEQNGFSNFNSPIGPNASQQVWAQSDLGFGSRCCFKISSWPPRWRPVDSQTERFKQFWISLSLQCFSSSFGSIKLTIWEELSFEEFQDGRRWISEWNNFSNSEYLCRSEASHQVLAQSDLRFWRICRLNNYTIFDIGTERF